MPKYFKNNVAALKIKVATLFFKAVWHPQNKVVTLLYDQFYICKNAKTTYVTEPILHISLCVAGPVLHMTAYVTGPALS